MCRIVASTERSQCTAFGKKDKRRCRLQRRPGYWTCEVHKRYYETWYETNRLINRRFMSKREIKELEFQIKQGYVAIPDAWVWQLREYSDIEWYLFLLEHTQMPADVNIYLFYTVIYEQIFYGYTWPNEKILQSFCREPSSCLFLFGHLIRWCERMSHGGAYSFLDLLQSYMSRFSWRALLYSQTLFTEFNTITRTEYQIFPENSEFWDLDCEENPIRRFFKYLHKKAGASIRERCSVYKEELMAAAWAPKRIQRWLDMGYDLDLLEEL